MIVIHPAAAAEARAARLRYAERDPAIARRFLAEYDRALERIEYEGSRFDERMSTRYAAGYFEMMRDFMRDGRVGATCGGSVITRPAMR